MSKNDSSRYFKLVVNIIIFIIIPLILGFAWYFVNRLDTQMKDIAQLDKKYAVIVTFLNIKMPGGNLPALVNLSISMNIPTDNVATAIHLLQTDHEQAKRYLAQDLNFTVDQVNSVMQPASIQDKKNLR